MNKDGLTAVDKVCGPAEIISCSEVKSAITKTKSGKAAGPSSVVAEMLRLQELECSVLGASSDNWHQFQHHEVHS